MIHGLKTYKSYRNSDLAWLGRVPDHWRQLPGKACFKEKQVLNTGLVEESVLSLSYGHIIKKPNSNLHGLVPESFETYQIINPGDIIVRPTDLQNDQTSLRFGLSKYRGIITSAYICLNANEIINREYGYLLLHAYDLKKVFYGLGSGLRQNLSWSDFKYLPCLIPPLSEQEAIVRYHNYMDRRIRCYIRDKQKLIKLLEEQKQAIIHRAVTRGLNPDVHLKSSGIEWLGNVPEHWSVKRCRYLFREIDVRSKDGSEEHLSMSQRLGLVPSHLVENRTLVSESYAGGKLCEIGDLVLNRLKAHLGVFSVARFSGVISPDYTVLRPIEADSVAYFELVLRSPACRYELRIRAKGIVEGFWRLYTDDFYDIRLPVPPLSERLAILNYIQSSSSEIERIIQKTHREITLSREYHARLISDVVTGKLDVREAAAHIPEEKEETERIDEADELTDTDNEVEDMDVERISEEAEG